VDYLLLIFFVEQGESTRAEVSKLWPTVQIWPTTCGFFGPLFLELVFRFLNGWVEKEYYFVTHKKIHEIKISLFINKVLLGHIHAHLFRYHMAAFVLQRCH